MKRTDVDDLVWEVSRHEVEPSGEVLADELLLAYRAGDLAAGEASRVEDALEVSAEARARLAELSGLDPAHAPESVRRRVLGDVPANGNSRSGWTAWRRLAAAAMLALAVGAAVYQLAGRGQNEGEHEVVATVAAADFDVNVTALARSRGVGAVSGVAEAFPRTEVRIRVEARTALSTPFELGVYRWAGQELARVEQGLEHELFQGAASVTGLARDLVGGESPGEYGFLLLVVPAGGLPESLRPQVGGGPWAVQTPEGGRIYRQSLRLLEP